ncbi:hypothetical protein B0J11DRAFT_565258 [Dendryphion nanum]|uniref:Uncharacterized protein n=1 Tax=Dendryphion nanum TaxID=256645 RepID=A0A9P9EEI4_9PLEO|nr:hypothetical protein B0J11DRAFT_565258 [Dendryphion nanum]
MPSSWVIPGSPSTCAAINRTVACPFELYANRSVLPNNLKIQPNLDITGSTIVKAFLASSITALILSGCLIVDKIIYHRGSKWERPWYLRLIHTIESLLLALSDQQLVAGIALILAVNAQACEITAYHYNVVCTMLLLSAITHLNTLVNISDLIFKGKSVALNRIIAVLIQIALTGLILFARHTNGIPMKSSALGALPAACFENKNASHGHGLNEFANFTQSVTGIGSNATFNASRIADNMKATYGNEKGWYEYITLVVFTLIALLFLLWEYYHARTHQKSDPHWASIIPSSISMVASVVIVVLVQKKYHQLRSEMEIDAWFNHKDQKKWTYSQLVTVLLLVSGSMTLVKAVTESLAGHRGRRYLNVAEKAAKDAQDAIAAKKKLLGNTNLPGEDGNELQRFNNPY